MIDPFMSELTRSAHDGQRHECELSASALAGLLTEQIQTGAQRSVQLQIQQVIDLGPLMHATVPTVTIQTHRDL